MTLGIPLYSDDPVRHDYIVQSRGAFAFSPVPATWLVATRIGGLSRQSTRAMSGSGVLSRQAESRGFQPDSPHPDQGSVCVGVEEHAALLMDSVLATANLEAVEMHILPAVESAVNQMISKRFVKKQQMRWTPRGAHLLLQVRTQVLNDELRSSVERWYPGFGAQDQAPLAA